MFPVLDDTGKLQGLVTGRGTREIAAAEDASWAIAADLMIAPVSVPYTAQLGEVAAVLLEHDLRAVPVIGPEGAIIGLVDEHDLSRAYIVGDRGAIATRAT